MRLLVAALPRPRVQRQLMLLGRAVVGGSIDEPRFAERDIGKRRIARRLVIDMVAAERGGERGVGNQRIVDGGSQRDGGGGHGEWSFISILTWAGRGVARSASRSGALQRR